MIFKPHSMLALGVALATLPFGQNALAAATKAQSDRPNILVVVADDLGYADLGRFGGEIDTPHLDALADGGIRFSNFHAEPACSPTRAALLTGVDPHKAGLGNMAEELAPNQEGKPGYEGFLNDRVVSVASLLKDSGYQTYLTGKWHLGKTEETSPAARGFEKSFALLVSGSHFDDMKPAYAPTPDAKALYREGMTMLDKLPDNFEYSTQFYADKMIDYIDADKDSGKPFFAYLAYFAPHWPLQAPDAALKKYEGRYDEGYDAIIERRLQKQKALGLIPANAEGAERPPKGKAWAELTPEQQKIEKRQMEIYAAMVDQIDVHTGRLVEYLKANDLYDNTVVLFISDNGPEGHDLDETWPGDQFPAIRKVIDETNDFSYEQMGRVGSYTFYGPSWAQASSPAFRLHKGFPTEGGTRVPAMLRMPDEARKGEVVNDLVTVRDVTPTLLELAGVEHPGTRYQDRDIEAMTGMSFASLPKGGSMPERVVGGELFGKRFIRAGDWKLVHMPEPWGTGDWNLYNLKTDLAERHDLAAKEPEKLAEMTALWEQYAADNNVILPDQVSGY